MSSSSTTATTANDVLLFIPNLIGYARVACTLIGLTLMVCFPTNNNHWLLAISLYLGSFVGDLLDGMAARKFHQSSTYGGLLDMVTDRCSTLGLLYVLGGDYATKDEELGFPIYRLGFLFLVLLDISSHWCQMYSTSSLQQAHHKSKEGNQGRNILVQLYYQYYWFFGYLCVGAEFTYVCLYILIHLSVENDFRGIVQYALYLCLPGCFLKQIVNVFQLASACRAVAQHDADLRNEQQQDEKQK